MPSSPQSIVPSGLNTVHQLLRWISGTQPDLRIQPPLILTANGQAFKRRQHCGFRQIQNCGVTAIKFLVDNVDNCTELNFHGIIAAGNAVDDGLGSVVNFSWTANRVTLFAVGGGAMKVCIFEGVKQDDSL